MADAADSKSADHKSCGFKSHQPHQKEEVVANKSNSLFYFSKEGSVDEMSTEITFFVDRIVNPGLN